MSWAFRYLWSFNYGCKTHPKYLVYYIIPIEPSLYKGLSNQAHIPSTRCQMMKDSYDWNQASIAIIISTLCACMRCRDKVISMSISLFVHHFFLAVCVFKVHSRPQSASDRLILWKQIACIIMFSGQKQSIRSLKKLVVHNAAN